MGTGWSSKEVFLEEVALNLIPRISQRLKARTGWNGSTKEPALREFPTGGMVGGGGSWRGGRQANGSLRLAAG